MLVMLLCVTWEDGERGEEERVDPGMVGDGAGHDAAASVEEADQRDEERGVRLGQAALLRDLNTACRQYLALHLVM